MLRHKIIIMQVPCAIYHSYVYLYQPLTDRFLLGKIILLEQGERNVTTFETLAPVTRWAVYLPYWAPSVLAAGLTATSDPIQETLPELQISSFSAASARSRCRNGTV